MSTSFTIACCVLGTGFGLFIGALWPRSASDKYLEQRRSEFTRICESPETAGYAVTSNGRFLCIKHGRVIEVYPKGVEP